MSDHLPEEVVREILLKLPIISILTCRRVCKAWYSLITNPNFISAHLAKTLVSTSSRFFIHQEYDINDCKNSMFIFDNQNHFSCVPLNLPSMLRVVDSCCGIVCMACIEVDFSVRYILCNPSTGNSLSIPRTGPNLKAKNSVHFWRSGFGYSDSTQDFKILLMITHDSNIWVGQMYSLNSNTWSNITASIPCIDPGIHFPLSTFVNGGLHWVVNVNSTNLVLAFDLKEETFAQISLPECLKPRDICGLRIKRFGESLIAIIHQTMYKLDVWVMKEYGAVDSWTKLATIGESGYSKVLGFVNDEEVLIKLESGYLASQTLESNVAKNLVYKLVKDSNSFLYDYVPSLLLLDKGNAGEPWSR